MDRFTELIELIAKCAGPADGAVQTAIPRVKLFRFSTPTQPLHSLHEPAICLVVQGKKRVLIGEQSLDYDSSRFLAASVDVPVIGQVIEASAEKPYLCFKLEIDRAMLAALALEMGPADAGDPAPGVALSPVTPELLDAALRLLRLADTPRDIPVLAPLAERELLYRLLAGEYGARLRQLAHADSKLSQVTRAINWIKTNYREAFSIETLASEARMSASALHLHFKQVTSLSPLQYQKQMRLQEARRLIFAESMDAANAAHEVGYESPSQFSREYRRLFGAPPVQDVTRLRETALTIGAAAP
ncbi:MAG TPA: AraC family transcriptional regulator [Vitreimonas sp.]|uniref:AraC family transcriptional regulator n=1 Tax=Vitreimonas sp. TaxID=3069702 RepID=UPI002D341F5B|nr:AraC family transcriptional regulator [Vitreimonas sp.]HYD86683.1 AraC family transcriptional regulator [Vitreimonas sp.]